MTTMFKLVGAFALSAALFIPTLPVSAQEVEPGFKSLFNGKDLTGWAGRTNHWSVQDGCITGITSKENPAAATTFSSPKTATRT